MQLTIGKILEESIDFGDKEIKEVAKHIADAIKKPDTARIIVRDAGNAILNVEQKHFELIKALMAL